uniref:Uncharacterized protein LOC105629532 isoform X1 n=1 Tax=Rhizophora mucronata TaxID=61149 RepID=A0A2P2JGW7_RHIMU
MVKRGAKSKSWHIFQNSWLPVLISSLVLVLMFLIFLLSDEGKMSPSSLGFPMQKWNAFGSVQFNPMMEFRNGTELVWQIPNSPKAVLFLAHGCNGRAVNFWDRSPSCPNCISLPEERLLVLHALHRQFAVITISSAGRCWTFGQELFVVQSIMTWWLGRNKLEKLPLVALGASSGGYFVSALATRLRFSSIALMIAEGIFDQMDLTKDYPPTLFVHMPKDLFRQQKISEFMDTMKNKGIKVAEIKCMEYPLLPSLLADRIVGLEQIVSAKLFKLFRDRGFIDKKGYLKRDGRATRWKEAVQNTRNIELDRNLVQHVQEELNLAFAYHEMTSLQSEQIFKWFESHMK